MRVSSAATNGASGAGAAAWQQRQQNFKALTQALQAGDLTAAKSAYATLAGKGTPAASSNSPLAQLGKALQANDIGAAQQAMASMRSRHSHTAPVSTAPVSDAPISTDTGSIHLIA